MLFEQLDTVIAFAAVMLLLSLMITTAVQAVISLLGLRGRNLFWGVEQLFRQLAPRQDAAMRRHARTIASEILGHEVLADGANWLRRTPWGAGRWGPGGIQLEEVRLVLGQAADRGFDGKLGPAVDGLLGEAAAEGLEVVDRAKSLVDGAEKWFDTVMDAAADRFKLWSRWWTVIFAVLMAFGLQVDSVEIMRQLSTDTVRDQVIDQIEGLNEVYSGLHAETAEDATAEAAAARLQALEEASATLEGIKQASSLTLFHPAWSEADFEPSIGMLMTALLLSLGAPFWYGALGKLVGFRSATSRRERPAAPPESSGAE